MDKQVHAVWLDTVLQVQYPPGIDSAVPSVKLVYCTRCIVQVNILYALMGIATLKSSGESDKS